MNRSQRTLPSPIQAGLILIPVVLFALQLIGRINPLATVAAGMLVCLKAIIEWMLAPRPAAPKKPAAPTALCARCKQVHDRHALLHLTVTADRHVRLCQACYHASRLSQCYSS